MLNHVGVFEISIIVRFAISELYAKRAIFGKEIIRDFLSRIVNVCFKKFIYLFVCVKCHEMAIACSRSRKQFKTVGVTYKPYKFIRNYNGLDVFATHIRFAVYFAEIILLIDSVIYLVNRVIARLFISDACIERTINRAYRVIPYGVFFNLETRHFILEKHAVEVEQFEFIIMVRNIVVYRSGDIYRRGSHLISARLVDVNKQFFIRTFCKLHNGQRIIFCV